MTRRNLFSSAALAAAAVAGVGLFAPDVSAAPPPAVGETAKDFTLNDLAGKPVKLSAETAKGPVVQLVLRGYPGYQCPLCTRQVGEFLAAAKEFEDKGARLLLVYPGPAENLQTHAKDFFGEKAPPANVVLLTDPDFTFTEAYNLRWKASGETAYPSTFVVGADGAIKFAVVSKTHGGRTKATDVLKAVPAR